MMHGAHIGGHRAGVFLELVGGLDPRRVLLVGVDVAKSTWFVVAANLPGEVMVDGVRLVADRAGLAELERLIATTASRLDAAVVVVGVEAAGHHHQTLVGHLGDRDGLVVRLLNPAQVAAVRKQQGNRRRKTDWLDAAAICELLARGEGSPVHLDASPAATLRPLWSGRKDLVDARGRLRQQAGALVDCQWPGFVATDSHAGVAPVLSSPSTPRPAGWWWGCWPRAGPQPGLPRPAWLGLVRSSPPRVAGCRGPWSGG
jgi:Transposase